MICENKNNLIDLFFHEGDEHKLSKIREHAANCKNCSKYLESLRKTIDMLDVLEDEKPSEKVFDNIMKEISSSSSKQVMQKNSRLLIPILAIALGQMILFVIVYFIKVKIDLMPVWESISKSWLLKSLGSTGAAVICILIVGAFLTLSFAPILMFESKKK